MAYSNPQAYPASRIAVGTVLYSCNAWTDDDGKTSTQINEWIVRSIQSKRGSKTRFGVPSPMGRDKSQFVNITQKLDYLTWGKRSTKNGDFGWLKNISKQFTKQFAVGSCLPRGIYTTIRAAVQCEINSTKEYLKACKVDGEPDEIANAEAQLEALTRRLARLNTKPNESTSKPKDAA